MLSGGITPHCISYLDAYFVDDSRQCWYGEIYTMCSSAIQRGEMSACHETHISDVNLY